MCDSCGSVQVTRVDYGLWQDSRLSLWAHTGHAGTSNLLVVRDASDPVRHVS